MTDKPKNVYFCSTRKKLMSISKVRIVVFFKYKFMMKITNGAVTETGYCTEGCGFDTRENFCTKLNVSITITSTFL